MAVVAQVDGRTSRLVRTLQMALAAIVLALGACLTPGALLAPASADHGIATTAAVAMRGAPSTTATSYGTIPSSTSPKYLCWTRGASVHGLTVWFLVNYHGHTGFIPSYYDNSHYASGSDIPSKYGIPTCSTSGHGISTTAAVTMRGTPHNVDANQGSVPKAVSPTYRCWIRGDSVGGLTVWFLVTYSGKTGFIPSHYDNSHYASASDIPSTYHIPSCGSTSTTPTTISAYAQPATSAHAKAAISWATGKLGSTAWDGLCLSFVRNAYASGGDDIRSQVSVTWGSNTYPQDIWGHFKSGKTGTGTPPAGAMVFYLANSGKSKTYSHVTIAADASTNTISTDDTYASKVHRETIAQHQNSGAWNHYVGWWLPN